MIDREERLEAPTKRKIDAGDWGGERRSRGKVKRGGGRGSETQSSWRLDQGEKAAIDQGKDGEDIE